MMRAASVVCDVVMLQQLLEFLGIIAWAIVTPNHMCGSPNSVTIVAISAQTTAEVELANFLTRKYFENTSATIRKSILFQIEDICCQSVPWKWWKFLSDSSDGL